MAVIVELKTTPSSKARVTSVINNIMRNKSVAVATKRGWEDHTNQASELANRGDKVVHFLRKSLRNDDSCIIEPAVLVDHNGGKTG